MANTAHLVRRQSSRDMCPQRSFDRLEMKEMRGRLVSTESTSSTYHSYGATNVAFEDSSPTKKVKPPLTPQLPTVNEDVFAPPAGEEEERESWDSKLTFILATIGYAVGLGNVWRFPYLAQKNGGGAFLIPYFVMLCIEGLPIFYLELAIGQRLRKGAIGVWSQVSPYLAGIGISSAVVAFNVALYYNTIIAWCLFYFAQSFQQELPWSECPVKLLDNGTYIEQPECTVSSPTRFFWYRTTLMVSEDINHPDAFNWKIAVALTIAWLLVYLCMMKGIASSSTIVYITAIFPYMVLIIFFFRGVMLKGMADGIIHMFTPKWHTLLDPVVWLEAGTQIFFSLGLAFGGLIAFSSYNPVHNNCYRDAILVSCTNCLTSMFAGVVVFAIIGFKATMTYENCLKTNNETLAQAFGSDVYKNIVEFPKAGTLVNFTENGVAHSRVMPELQKCSLEDELDNSASGTGLAFIIFTEAINQFPYSQLWAVLFFLMLFTLGIDSQFGTLEGVISSVVDMKLFPNMRKDVLTGLICLLNAFLSLMFAHGAGSYIFVLFDNFAGNFPLLIVAFFECIAISYVYGIKRFADDIELMTGNRPGLYWLICWKYVSPLAMISILVASILQIVLHGSGYDAWVSAKGVTEKLDWPPWCMVLIAFLILASVIWIPLVAILRCFGIVIVEDSERAWFPADELKDLYGIMPHEVTQMESFLFCIRPDGTEGLCCPTGPTVDDYDGALN